jgi:hypothetical protein
MTARFYYKGADISSLIEPTGTTTVSQFSGFPAYTPSAYSSVGLDNIASAGYMIDGVDIGQNMAAISFSVTANEQEDIILPYNGVYFKSMDAVLVSGGGGGGGGGGGTTNINDNVGGVGGAGGAGAYIGLQSYPLNGVNKIKIVGGAGGIAVQGGNGGGSKGPGASGPTGGSGSMSAIYINDTQIIYANGGNGGNGGGGANSRNNGGFGSTGINGKVGTSVLPSGTTTFSQTTGYPSFAGTTSSGIGGVGGNGGEYGAGNWSTPGTAGICRIWLKYD